MDRRLPPTVSRDPGSPPSGPDWGRFRPTLHVVERIRFKKKHDNAVRTDDGRERITSRWSGRRGISWREEGEEIIRVSKRHEERIVFTSNDRARILGGTNPWVERRNVPNRVGCPTGTTRVEGFVPVRWEHEAKRHVSKEIIQEDQKRGSFRKRDRCRER